MMNIETGRYLDLVSHVKQSVHNILFTSLGSRPMRENYGSLLPELIDRPVDSVLIMQVASATYVAIKQWEPRLSLEKILINHQDDGLIVELFGTINNDPVKLKVYA